MVKFSVLVSTLFFCWHIGKDALRCWREGDIWLSIVNTVVVVFWIGLMARLFSSEIVPPEAQKSARSKATEVSAPEQQ